MQTFRDVIKAGWSSAEQMAKDINVPVRRAEGWFERDSIPAPYLKAVQVAARRNGVKLTAQDILDIAANYANGAE